MIFTVPEMRRLAVAYFKNEVNYRSAGYRTYEYFMDCMHARPSMAKTILRDTPLPKPKEENGISADHKRRYEADRAFFEREGISLRLFAKNASMYDAVA